MEILLQNVREDIIQFLEVTKMFFFNERDLQVNLALYLTSIKDRGYKVQLEYHIPTSELRDYPWEEDNISIDLVVEKGGQYVPIEIKYKTRSLPKGSHVMRFGVPLDASDIIKNQNAQDLGRYGFWKDVKRLEQLKEKYGKIIGGVALFVTNDESYTKRPNGGSVGYYDFRMLEGDIIKNSGDFNALAWRRNGIQYEPEKKSSCGFKLNNEYIVPRWNTYASQSDFGKNQMFYNLLLVE